MIKKQIPLDQSKPRYLITPSLLNAWLYIWESARNVIEYEKDEVCLEDKRTDTMEKSKLDFIDTLNKIQKEPNEYMKEGLAFEDRCYKGNSECAKINEIIKGGAFQIVGTKQITVDDIDFLMYGRLDVLKGGVIYDIKRVWKYKKPKYQWSSQHRFYLDLFPEAKMFEYLIYDGSTMHLERYFSDNCTPTELIIKDFIKWLKKENLLEIYLEKWRAK